MAGVRTIEEANAYLAKEYLPWWNQTLTVESVDATDAHRPLGQEHDLASIPSQVEQRQVTNDYTVRYSGKIFKSIARTSGWDVQSYSARRGALGRNHRHALPRQVRARAPLGTTMLRTAVGRSPGGHTPHRQRETQKRLDKEFLCPVWSLSTPGHRGVQCSRLRAGATTKGTRSAGQNRLGDLSCLLSPRPWLLKLHHPNVAKSKSNPEQKRSRVLG